MRPYRFSLLLATAAVLVAGCAPRPASRTYHLEGQVLAVNPATREITIRHTEIPGLMPGMTMPFKVNDPAIAARTKPGDLVNGTLVVTRTESYLSALTTVGSMPLERLPRSVSDTVLEPGQTVPDAELLDQDGRAFRLSSFHGRILLVTFTYTRCPLPDYCPLMDRNFSRIQQALAASRVLGGRVHLLTVSFDPAHDTPAVLEAHARGLGADPAVWTFATGKQAALDALCLHLGVFVTRNDGGVGLITHNLRTALIDGRGRLVKIYDGNDWTPAQALRDLASAAGV